MQDQPQILGEIQEYEGVGSEGITETCCRHDAIIVRQPL